MGFDANIRNPWRLSVDTSTTGNIIQLGSQLVFDHCEVDSIHFVIIESGVSRLGETFPDPKCHVLTYLNSSHQI